MSLTGIELHKLNEHLDFGAVTQRFKHKLLPGNFALVPIRTGGYLFCLLGRPNFIKKIMIRQNLFGLQYIDYENKGQKFDPSYHAEDDLEWFLPQLKQNGFKEIKQFIRW